jgi:anti-sigma factor RsiW
MPNCDEIIALLSDYLDRDLPPDTCAVVESHLGSCPTCGEEADGLRRTLALCRQYRSEDRPGPLPADKHRELAAAFQKVLALRLRER